MATSDMAILYPEARTHLRQLGFDPQTMTIDQLISGDYIREYSTVVEFIDSTDDTKFHSSIADKLGIPAMKNAGFMMVIYKSLKAHQFIFFDANGMNLACGYNSDSGWYDPHPLAGSDVCSISNPNNYVPISLRWSGDVKYFRAAGYLTKQMSKGSEYTLGIIPEDLWWMYKPRSGQYYGVITVTSDGKLGILKVTTDRKIMFSPSSDTLPADTGININATYI